jgi:hypothetical protein
MFEVVLGRFFSNLNELNIPEEVYAVKLDLGEIVY